MDDVNDLARKITAAAASKIPYVGGLVAFVVPRFWPETGPSLWEQLESKVQNLIDQSLARYKMEELRADLVGLRKDVNKYTALTNAEQKRGHLEALDSAFNNAAPHFMSGDPAKNFTFFWGMALLHLAVLKERVDLYVDDANREQLRCAAISYSAFGRVALARIYTSRLEEQFYLKQISENAAGKASDWVIDVSFTDTKNNIALYRYGRYYKGGKSWSGATLDADTAECARGFFPVWYNAQKPLHEEITALAYGAIQELEARWPYDQSTALALLKEDMGDSAYGEFIKSFYPTKNFFNDPSTDRPVEPKPIPPNIKLNPFRK